MAERNLGNNNPLSNRTGLLVEAPETNYLAKELGKLAERHGLMGAVLISFKGNRVGVNSSGEGAFADAMIVLGDQVLAAIDDGKFDPETSVEDGQ